MPPRSGCDTRRHAIVNQILRYLAGTWSYDSHYTKKLEEPRFVGYSDSDMVGDRMVQELRTRIGIVKIKKAHQELGVVC